jgi:hypothetical protein
MMYAINVKLLTRLDVFSDSLTTNGGCLTWMQS